jgi:hypothetical protein
MKRILLLTACAAPLLWAACSNDPAKTADDVVPQGMTAVDLTAQGFPIKINVPDSTNGALLVTEGPGGVEIKVGNKYDVIVNVAAGEDADLKNRKALIAATDAGVSTFTTENDSMLVWETKFGEVMPGDTANVHIAAHFCVLRKLGTDTYIIHDNNDNTENQFAKAVIDKMVESAKSLRAKPAATEPKS